MARPDQEGIKWWWCCQVCTWSANTRNNDNDNEICPNCNNPNLTVCTDEEVFQERRYDARVRNTKEQTVADQVRQNQGRPPAPPDTVNTGNRGYNYTAHGEEKPFPDP